MTTITQPDFWSDPVPPHVRGSQTSAEAADRARPFVAGQRALILGYLERHGPASDETIANVLELNPSAERPRRVELERAGLIRKAGHGITKAGRKCQLWAVA